MFITQIRICSLLILANLLAGCGVQFFYNNLDSMVRMQLEDYIELTESQEAFFEAEFASLWTWHRQEELPQYAADLDDWARLADDGIIDSEIDQAFTTMQAWWQRVEAKGTPSAMELLIRLEDSQVQELEEAFAELNVKREKRMKRLDVEDRRRRWAKNFERLLERFTGSLDTAQKQYLKRGAERYRPASALWREYSLAWQKEFLSLLRVRHDAEAFANGYAYVFGPQEALYSEELKAAQAHNEALSKVLILSVLDSMKELQRERFRETLAKRARELRELAAETGS